MITLFVSCKTQSAYKLRMIPFRIIVSIFIIVFPIPTRAQCNSSCGSKGKTVPYPFGFSSSCPIQLNCSRSNSEIQLKELQLQVSNITSQSIFLSLSDDCGRTIESIYPLFNKSNNYRPTTQNSLLLKTCNNTQHNDCVLPTSLFPSNSMTCDSNSKNVSCFPQRRVVSDKKQHFLDLDAVKATTCKSLLSSIFVESNGNGSALSLQFHTLELQWWLKGSCSFKNSSVCSKNSNCTDVKSNDGRNLGFRCGCSNGFRGDGYQAGEGCRKSESTPLQFIFSPLFS